MTRAGASERDGRCEPMIASPRGDGSSLTRARGGEQGGGALRPLAPSQLAAALASVPPCERDAWVDAALETPATTADEGALPAGCVPYLPCPVGAVLDAVRLAGVSADDVFVDVGSGIGRVLMLVHRLTGARCVGLELQPALVDASRRWMSDQGIAAVRVLAGDAPDILCEVPEGSVYFLYCPFGGERLERVLAMLEMRARLQTIRICAVHLPRLDRSWLRPVEPSLPDLTVYTAGC